MAEENQPTEELDAAVAKAGIIGNYIKRRFDDFSRRLTGLEEATRTYGEALTNVGRAQDEILRGQGALHGELQGLYTEIRNGAEATSRIEARLGGIETNYEGLNGRIDDLNTSVATLASGVEETRNGVEGVRSDFANLRERVEDLEAGRPSDQPGFFKKYVWPVFEWFTY